MSKQTVRQVGRDTCYFCEGEGPLEQHHILPQRLDGSDADGNLVDVCPTCHMRLEQLYDDRVVEELAPHMDPADADGPALDRFDTKALSGLVPGDELDAFELRQRFEEAGIYRDETRKRHVKKLTRLGYLEYLGGQVWRYLGGGRGE